ncbi:zinc-dependent metalloprotease [Flavobacterium sp. XGLA_31]|uniref:zinc-dependent metalloprotease n=1 Tax=Flavobacterium sp. XGLA_31 TaxID=3447666 RepID=UPI003F3699D3
MKKILLLTFVLSISQIFAQKNNAWSFIDNERSITSERVKEMPYSENQKLVAFNFDVFKQQLVNVAQKASGQAGVEIVLPNVDGGFEKFLIWESSNFEPELQAKFPNIKAYAGIGVTDPTAKLYFSFAPIGIQTMVMRADNGSEFIEAFTKDKSAYVVFDSKTRIKGNLPFNCTTKDVEVVSQLKNNLTVLSSAQIYKTMRLALSCTGEYGAYFGGTTAGALAGMNATMTRCNGIYENDLAVKLLMIDNTAVIYTDAASDPYSDASGMDNWNAELQTTLTDIIGEANYDIGHLFGASGGGGNAGCIGCVCVNGSKGSGITSPGTGGPVGDNFDIDYVAHEMGHQMGANHTFTHTTENNAVNVEPGSGSTIMGYAGITGSTDVQAHSDPYYAFKSISQIQTNLGTKSCPISYNASSTPAYTNLKPTVSAGADYTIPIGTAFKLTGTATGQTGEALTYCWEENDDATTSLGPTLCFPSPTKTNGPNFRSRPPSTSNVRYLPPLASVLAGNLTTTWETVSTVGRTLNFALTVRDNVLNGGQTNTDAMIVTVLATAGPFTVTSQNTNSINWIQGSQETITWNVANTTALAGSANVNIKLSTDGGLNFDTVLASNTPNDGSEIITVPAVQALNCRIMVEAAGNIYYAVNSKAFTIGANCRVYTATPNAAIADGSGTNTAGATTTSVLNVPDAFTISGLKVNLKIDHTRIGDLVVKITHPDGTLRTLWNRTCNSAVYSGIDMTFADGTGTITSACASPTVGTHQASQASTALAGYNNKTSAGNWTLTVTDNSATNTGTLVSWGLDFGCTLANSEFEISNVSVYPNPNRGNFNIQFDNPAASEIKVVVYDMRGRKIFENNYANQATFNENIQLENAQAGVYLVNVIDGSKKVTKKIVVE